MASPYGAFAVGIPQPRILLQGAPGRKARLKPEDPTSGVSYATVSLAAAHFSFG